MKSGCVGLWAVSTIPPIYNLVLKIFRMRGDIHIQTLLSLSTSALSFAVELLADLAGRLHHAVRLSRNVSRAPRLASHDHLTCDCEIFDDRIVAREQIGDLQALELCSNNWSNFLMAVFV
jgi:hypothetical protein